MSQSDTIEWLRAKLTGPEGVLDIVARSSQIPAVVASGSASQAGSAATPRALVKSHALSLFTVGLGVAVRTYSNRRGSA
jgi:hypothetical protein